MDAAQLFDPLDQLVGGAGHGGHVDGDLIAGATGFGDTRSDGADPFKIAHRRTTVFLHHQRQKPLPHSILRADAGVLRLANVEASL